MQQLKDNNRHIIEIIFWIMINNQLEIKVTKEH